MNSINILPESKNILIEALVFKIINNQYLTKKDRSDLVLILTGEDTSASMVNKKRGRVSKHDEYRKLAQREEALRCEGKKPKEFIPQLKLEFKIGENTTYYKQLKIGKKALENLKKFQIIRKKRIDLAKSKKCN